MNDRLGRIVQRMKIQPDDKVLEIGCGHGIAASLICESLRSGHLVAVDRSAKMIAAATRRNARHVEAGRAEFICADFESVDLGARRFTKILAARVALFERDPRAREALKRLLAPGGRMFIEYDEPAG
ncbi:class I SAM-dependent methyltransferase [Caenimonas sedimenti]|uniref:Class I SAM-dependent methyltransferase n=1 Tax=Caenimonas sedimenti TaxID=2596921 RepID=A0A562ZMA6_9BURK|nr:class I SAM-dependent methyltransferase [Caenimonas sedimenti]TWO69486.1 class I SAM-dependent methyltransferase [Caenimonas sedimenti]